MKACCKGCSSPFVAKAFDGRDLGAVFHDCECQAGQDAAPVEQDGAGAALAVVAAFLVPVRSRCSRSASSSVVQGRIAKDRSTPLTRRVTVCLGGNSAAGCFWGFSVELCTSP